MQSPALGRGKGDQNEAECVRCKRLLLHVSQLRSTRRLNHNGISMSAYSESMYRCDQIEHMFHKSLVPQPAPHQTDPLNTSVSPPSKENQRPNGYQQLKEEEELPRLTYTLVTYHAQRGKDVIKNQRSTAEASTGNGVPEQGLTSPCRFKLD